MSATLALPSWLPTFEDRAAQERRLAQTFVLVRIAGNAGYDLMRCGRCRQKHPYLTLQCLPQPFSGAYRGIWAYYHALGLAGAEMQLSPAERARFALAATLFGPSKGLPALATSHPRLAREMGTDEADADIGAFALGVLEQISLLVAQRLLDAINDTGLKPPLVVPGLMTNGRLGVLVP